MTAVHAGQTGGERAHTCGEECALWGCDLDGPGLTLRIAPSRPVPVAGQEAREAAVAVSMTVTVRAGDRSSADRLAAAVADLVRAEFGAHVALSAAGGQVWGRYEPEPGSPRDDAAGVHTAAGGQET